MSSSSTASNVSTRQEKNSAADNAIVLSYLRKMGYRQTERFFKEEANSNIAPIESLAFELKNEEDSSISNYLLFHQNQLNQVSSAGVEPSILITQYKLAYQNLKQWIDGSLDSFKEELGSCLFPIFVHINLDLILKGFGERVRVEIWNPFSEEHRKAGHDDEISALESIKEPQHIKESQLASSFRIGKYNIVMSVYSFQLLMSYLQDEPSLGNLMILKILNQFINIRVLLSSSSSSKSTATTSTNSTATKCSYTTGLTGSSQSEIYQLNSSPIHWGVYPVEPEMEVALFNRAKVEGGMHGRLGELLMGPLANLKRQYSRSIQMAPPIEEVQKDEADYDDGGVGSTEQQRTHSYIKGGPPRPPPTAPLTQAEVERLRALAKRALLSQTQLPSICQYTLHHHYDAISTMEFNEMGTILATGNKDSHIELWSLTPSITRPPSANPALSDGHVSLRALKPSTELAATLSSGAGAAAVASGTNASDSPIANIPSVEALKEYDDGLGSNPSTRRLIGHCGPVYGISFLGNDNKLLISAGMDGEVRLWSLDMMSCLVIYKGHSLPIWSLASAPLSVGPYFVTGSADRTLRLWSTEHPGALRVFSGHLSDVMVVKFHPNGNYLFSGSADRTIRMWDIQTGQCCRLMASHQGSVRCLSPSPDGSMLVSGDTKGQLCLWRLEDGSLVKKWDAGGSSTASNTMMLNSVSFDRDGRIVCSGGSDMHVRMWSVEAILNDPSPPQPLASLPTKQTPIHKLHFTYRNILLSSGPYM